MTPTQRLTRIKQATETVEDELNRLPEPGMGRDYDLADAMHAVIAHLKRRYAQFSEEATDGK